MANNRYVCYDLFEQGRRGVLTSTTAFYCLLKMRTIH